MQRESRLPWSEGIWEVSIIAHILPHSEDRWDLSCSKERCSCYSQTYPPLKRVCYHIRLLSSNKVQLDLLPGSLLFVAAQSLACVAGKRSMDLVARRGGEARLIVLEVDVYCLADRYAFGIDID